LQTLGFFAFEPPSGSTAGRRRAPPLNARGAPGAPVGAPDTKNARKPA